MGNIACFSDDHGKWAEGQLLVCNKFIANLYDLPGYRGVFMKGKDIEDHIRVKKYNHVDLYGNKYNKPGEKTTKLLRYPDKLVFVLWDNSLWAPQLLEYNGCISYYSRGDRMYDVEGIDPACLLGRIHKDEEFNKMAWRRFHDNPDHWILKEFEGVKWVDNYKGMTIFEYLQKHKDSTFATVLAQLERDGGHLDGEGRICKG